MIVLVKLVFLGGLAALIIRLLSWLILDNDLTEESKESNEEEPQ